MSIHSDFVKIEIKNGIPKSKSIVISETIDGTFHIVSNKIEFVCDLAGN